MVTVLKLSVCPTLFFAYVNTLESLAAVIVKRVWNFSQNVSKYIILYMGRKTHTHFAFKAHALRPDQTYDMLAA